MFDRLTDTFHGLYRKLSGQATISESNVKDAIADVRAALLDADVNLDVVNAFTTQVLSDALGREVTKSLKPGEEMIGIVHRRLVEFLGGTVESSAADASADLGLPPGAIAPSTPPTATDAPLVMRVSPGPAVVMLSGLQGSGKTTTCGKLAAYLKKRGRSVMLVAADLQRPAAIDQLRTVAATANTLPGGAQVTFYGEPEKAAEYGQAVGVAVGVCQRAIAAARQQGIDTVILDTAGRLHVNDALMGELQQVKKLTQPHHIFLVVDAMSGQDALHSAKSFHDRLDIDGIILTKFDSDTRGGAALSVKHVTGAPVKFVGVGEKLEALEEFHPTRVAGRILGMGDVVSLVEKAQQEVSEADAQRMQDKLAKGEMGMDDFLDQMKKLRRMGPMKQLLGLLPGVGSMLKDVNIDDKQLDRVEAIISSMNQAERAKPALIDNSRRRRIAAGSGTTQNEVGQLVKQFQAVSQLSRQMATMSASGKVKAVRELQASGGMGGMLPGLQGMPSFGAKGSSHSPSVKDRFKKRKR